LTAGGVGRPAGAVAGGYAVLLFIEATRFAADVLPGLKAVEVAAFREILIGAALLIMLHLKPQGFLPETMPKAPKP
jgi:branched-chain amino acid transport system permease protein